MTKHLISLAAALALASPALAQEDTQRPATPGEAIESAAAEEWIAIDPADLIVMTLGPDEEGTAREVVMQLIPAPFVEDWTANIRLLTRTGWFDDTAILRVQDNYVVQWGDPLAADSEDEQGGKPFPNGMLPTSENAYTVPAEAVGLPRLIADSERSRALDTDEPIVAGDATTGIILANGLTDAYAQLSLPYKGWPLASDYGKDENEASAQVWPVHCYGMIGVARGLSPNAGDGSGLYTIIGHAPRHLDRNLAVVGRVIEGIEHLASLPRGTGTLGFYEEAEERTPIVTVRMADALPEADQPRFEYLDTEGPAFAHYVEARANRSDDFFIAPAGGIDICNIPIPVRRVSE